MARLSLGVALVCHDERVSPLAGGKSVLGHLTAYVDVEVFVLVVNHGCLGQLTRSLVFYWSSLRFGL